MWDVELKRESSNGCQVLTSHRAKQKERCQLLSFPVIFIVVGIGLWLCSFAVEALRPAPKPPKTVSWAREIPVAYVNVVPVLVEAIKQQQKQIDALKAVQEENTLLRKQLNKLSEAVRQAAMGVEGWTMQA